MAIGAQNAFVLRQGLRREHVASVVVFCAFSDALLITAGVYGMSQALQTSPQLANTLALTGAGFLTWYGWKALQRMKQASQLNSVADVQAISRWAAVAQAAAFTLLNPHVYLDTVLLVGSMGAQHTPTMQPWFVLGASTASALWFGSLGFGARWLSPWFANPKAWQILDGLIGATMWIMAALLLSHVMH